MQERSKLVIIEHDLVYDKPEPVENLITWVYEVGSFVPSAKIVGEEKFSIVNDYIRRPVQVYNENGDVVWDTDYDIYGDLRELKGDRSFIPFRQLGQYEDQETGLYYNRFRYYNPETGTYLSQDPIGLAGNNPNFYAYVKDTNGWIDIFGLNLISGESLSDATKLFRIGGSDVGNLGLKPGEMGLDPPGISVIRAKTAEEAGQIMKDALPNVTRLHDVINSGNIAEIDAKSIREAGFDVIHNPTGTIGDAHARLIHPDGIDGFNKSNLSILSDKFKCH